jgi:hypothetical protein
LAPRKSSRPTSCSVDMAEGFLILDFEFAILD